MISQRKGKGITSWENNKEKLPFVKLEQGIKQTCPPTWADQLGKREMANFPQYRVGNLCGVGRGTE